MKLVNSGGAFILNNDILEAVHDNDIEELLESLGVLENFNNGEFKCKYCGDIMTKHNLSALFPDNEEVGFCCDKTDCIASLFREDNSK